MIILRFGNSNNIDRAPGLHQGGMLSKRRNIHLAVMQSTDFMQLQKDYESGAFLILSAEVLVAIALVASFAKVKTQILKQGSLHAAKYSPIEEAEPLASITRMHK